MSLGDFLIPVVLLINVMVGILLIKIERISNIERTLLFLPLVIIITMLGLFLLPYCFSITFWR